MSRSRVLIASALAVTAAFALPAEAKKKTVCTVTVNSPDEKETMRKRLPAGEYEFVELVEKGRPDWLRSSCERKVQCDVLVVSGHFNGGDTFYSDRLENPEHLEVDEMERASCSQSCPGVFANLKEVYLFGCESLNPDATRYASAYGESGRERMRRLFSGVPVIYGFHSSAPVGPTAAMLLERWFANGGGRIGTGQPNAGLLRTFARNNMTWISGRDPSGRERQRRADICGFYDERLSHGDKLRHVHATMRRDMGNARLYFERIEALLAAIPENDRTSPDVSHALAEISADEAARERFLQMARSEAPRVRARMISLARTFAWLREDEKRDEYLALVNDILAQRKLGFAEVDLVCSIADDGTLVGQLSRVNVPEKRRAPHSAVLACLGSNDGRNEVLAALASADTEEVQVAQTYLRHRPISDPPTLRRVASEVARMPGSPAKVRALDALARLRIGDRDVLEELARSFSTAKTPEVQRALAEVFIRSDPKALPRPTLASVLREHRMKTKGGGEDLIDVLLAKLGAG